MTSTQIAPSVPVHEEELAHNKVGLGAIVFQSITTLGPAAGTIAALPLATSYAGGSTALAILVAMILCLFVSVVLGEMGKRIETAGGMASYTAAGLGPRAGIVVSWSVVLVYASILMFVWSYMGIIVRDEIRIVDHGFPGWTWVPIGLIVAAVVWFLIERGIALSARAGIILGLLELTVLVALSFTLIVKAGSHNSLKPFTLHNGNPGGFSSLVTAVIYAMFAFIGFEASAPIGEEAKDAKRTVPISMRVGLLAGGCVYVLAYYAVTVYLGAGHMLTFIGLDGGNPWTQVTGAVWGGVTIMTFLALCNSFVANANSAANATTRMLFSMGRAGEVPRPLAAVNRAGTPIGAIRFIMVTSIVVSLVLGIAMSGGPLAAFAMLGTELTVLMVICYMVVAVACTRYFLRVRRAEFNPVLHLLCPLVVVVCFIPCLMATVGIKFAGLNIAPVVGVAKAGVWFAVVWLVLGAVYAWFAGRGGMAARVPEAGTVALGD
jgi:amino acid transporter